MNMLEGAQGGRLFAQVAESLDLDAEQTRRAMARLCPAIALKLKERAAEDDDLFESLLDLIEDGAECSPLEEPEALTDAEAISDGHAILEDVYGSRNAAMVALRSAAQDVPERELARLAPISATAVVAALAQANRPRPMALTSESNQPAPQPASSAIGSEGVIGTLVGAVIAGAVSGIVRELTSARRWRGTTGYTKTRTKRKTTKSRTSKSRSSRSSKSRTTAANSRNGIEDIFRDILGNLAK